MQSPMGMVSRLVFFNQGSQTMFHKNKMWTPIVHFAAHVVVGSLLFLVIATPAVGLSLLVHALESAHLDSFTIAVLTFLEHAILVADAVLFIIYMMVTALKSVKEMWK